MKNFIVTSIVQKTKAIRYSSQQNVVFEISQFEFFCYNYNVVLNKSNVNRLDCKYGKMIYWESRLNYGSG
jgi:hypothetical protein